MFELSNPGTATPNAMEAEARATSTDFRVSFMAEEGCLTTGSSAGLDDHLYLVKTSCLESRAAFRRRATHS